MNQLLIYVMDSVKFNNSLRSKLSKTQHNKQSVRNKMHQIYTPNYTKKLSDHSFFSVFYCLEALTYSIAAVIVRIPCPNFTIP